MLAVYRLSQHWQRFLTSAGLQQNLGGVLIGCCASAAAGLQRQLHPPNRDSLSDRQFWQQDDCWPCCMCRGISGAVAAAAPLRRATLSLAVLAAAWLCDVEGFCCWAGSRLHCWQEGACYVCAGGGGGGCCVCSTVLVISSRRLVAGDDAGVG